MKKILLVVIFINMILSGPGSILAVSALTMHTQPVDTTIVLSVSFPAFDPEWMRSTSQGLSIMMPGYDHLTTPGDPALPVQHLLIALPPQASVLSLEGTGGDVVKIPGTYDIRSAPSPIPLDGTGCSYDALRTPLLRRSLYCILLNRFACKAVARFSSIRMCLLRSVPSNILRSPGSYGIPQRWS